MRIGILGCGWIGQKLAQTLLAHNHEVYTTNTTQEKSQQMQQMGCHAYVVNFLDINSAKGLADTFKNLDFITISVSVSRRADLNKQKKIFRQVVNFLNGYQGKSVLLSTTGIYPQENKTITETTYKPDQLHPKIYTVEQIVQQGLPQTNVLRLGGLLGADRLMTQWIKDINQISQPNHPVNHVHYLDVISILIKLSTSNIQSEVFNVVAPEHPTKKEVFLGKPSPHKTAGPYRVVDGSKLQNTLSYTYLCPNPIDFS